MDDNRNQDGFNGLPLESWLNQQHLSSAHASLSTQVYNQPMSAQSIHDFMSQRALQFAAVEPIPHIGQSSQTVPPLSIHQYSLSSSSARLHQPEQLSTSHERSAWSHLLSLDPSVASMGSHMSEPQESLRHCLPQDSSQAAQNTRQDQLLMLKGNTKLTTSFDNKSLPKMHLSLASSSTACIPLDSYSHLPSANSSQNKMSQHFTQLMNMSKKVSNPSKPPVPKTLAISNDVSSLESSGSYSPVSPPAADIDQSSLPPSSQNSGRVAELFLRDSHEIPSNTFNLLSSSDHADIFSYLSEKTDTFSSDLSVQDSYSEIVQPLTVSSLLPSPSDMPLDMTTAFGSKADKGNGLKEFSQIGTEVASSDLIHSDKPSIIQSLLTKDQVHPREFINEMNASTSLPDRNQSQFTLPVIFDEKLAKPIKSTPKKSNFYGRDASLFSFVPSSSFSSEKQVSAPDSSEPVGTDITENKNLNIANETSSDVASTQEPDKTNAVVAEGSKLVTDVHPSISYAESAMSLTDSVANASTSSANLPVLGCIPSQSQSDDTIPESFDVTETVFKQNDENTMDAESTENYDSANGNYKCVLNSNGNIMISGAVSIEKEHNEENVNHWKQNFEIPGDDFLATNITSKIKSKRRKRKASGFQSKQRKKPVKKQLRIKQSDVFDDISMNVESNDHSPPMDTRNTEISEQQDYESVSFSSDTVTIKRKTRQLSKAKAASVDMTPRRSSSRKSKDNAMRLIELQADSNYSGISQTTDVVEKKSTRKRKKSKSSLASIASDDFNDFSDDSTEEDRSDDHDGDYVVDEDEIEVLHKDEITEQQQMGKKVITERKLGGLKISIKLSGNSSAEIVSGIDDSPIKKKRKTAKKKNMKNKGKDKVKIHAQQVESDDQEILNSSATEGNTQETTNVLVNDKVEEAGNSSDVKDRHMSLMEKYFSKANSATVARQIHKKTVSGKEVIAKKKNTDGTKSKLGSNLTLKSGGTVGAKKQSDQVEGGKPKASVKFSLESTVKKDKAAAQEDAETGIAKFVCGYCPQRYHNKQELLAHMEAHMVEMERKIDTEVVPAVDENIKDQAATVNLSASRGPKSNRLGTSAINSARPVTSEGIAEKEKLKSTGDQTKDPDVKLAQSAMKQKLKCGECGQVFDSKPSLLDHVRIHTADKPFECDICHKCFTERNFLSAHRKTHGQEKLLRCPVCSKAFVYNNDLTLHMQSHPRRSVTKSTGTVSVKKSFKKGVHEKHDEEEDSFPSKKPKSFASALTGEMDMSGKTSDTPPVLILTRRDGPPIEVKISSSSATKAILSEPKVSLKPITATVNKPNVIVKISNYVKKPIEGPLVSSSVKGDNSRMDVKSSNDMESNSETQTSEAASSSNCTCKECPDCVTRFLQSFE